MPALPGSPRHFATAARLTGLAGVAVLAVLTGCASIPDGDAPPLPRWTQVLPERQLSLRAIVPAGTACPSATVDGVAQSLHARVGAPSSDFPVTLCERAVATTTRQASIAGQPLPLAAAEIRRIVIVGDTGCRIKVPASGHGDPLQDCTNPAAWPWARVAGAAAATQPDLVIHLGDYHYREYCRQPALCAALSTQGTPVGYDWAGWNADFFTPAAALLRAAPWVTVRGNHENCDRGGEGWQRLLSPLPPQTCPTGDDGRPPRSVLSNNATAAAYRVELPGLPALIVADNAGHEDYRAADSAPHESAVFEKSLAALLNAADRQPFWLLIHKPLWYDLLAADLPANSLQTTLRTRLPATLSIVFAGHEHAFQTINFATAPATTSAQNSGQRPAQLIVGNSGTQLEIFDPASPFFANGQAAASQERWQANERLYDGSAAASGVVVHRYGFLLLERVGDDPTGPWTGSLRDPDGRPLADCRLDNARKRVHCAPAAVH